jgi:WhiB family redox-sensing transcriptional regulator
MARRKNPVDLRFKVKEPMFDASQGNCVGKNPDIFMPEGKDHITLTRQAKAVCSDCPLVDTCLGYAIRNEEWGIWGGSTRDERKYLRRFPNRVASFVVALRQSGGRRDFVTLRDENALFTE